MWMYRILCGTRLRTFWMNIPGMLYEADHRTIDLRRVCISGRFRDWCFTSPLPLHPHQHSLLLILRGGGDGVFGSESTAGAVPQESSHCFLRLGLSVIWGTLTQQSMLARKSQEPSLLPPAVLELQVHAIISGLLYMGSWRVKLQSSNSMHKHFAGQAFCSVLVS